MNLLEAKGLNSYYGDSHILFDVSLRVGRNEVVGLLGRTVGHLEPLPAGPQVAVDDPGRTAAGQ